MLNIKERKMHLNLMESKAVENIDNIIISNEPPKSWQKNEDSKDAARWSKNTNKTRHSEIKKRNSFKKSVEKAEKN